MSHVIRNSFSRALQSVSWFFCCYTNNYIVTPEYTSCGQTRDYPIVIYLWPLCLERVQINYISCISFYHKTYVVYILRYGILVTFYFVCLLLAAKYTRFLMSDIIICYQIVAAQSKFWMKFSEGRKSGTLLSNNCPNQHTCGYDTCMIISSYSNTAQNQIVGDFVNVCFFVDTT